LLCIESAQRLVNRVKGCMGIWGCLRFKQTFWWSGLYEDKAW
jgi:hypothetical protein